MKIKNFFLFSAFVMSTLSFSTQIGAEENVEENNYLVSKCYRSKKERKNSCGSECVFASFRCNLNKIVCPSQNIPFNIEDNNCGDGIHFNPWDSSFTITKCGQYLINYGVQTVSEPVARGINLVQKNASCGVSVVRNSTQVNVPTAVVVSLSKGDTIQLVPQQCTQIVPGSMTTSIVDTAFITFSQITCSKKQRD